MAAGSSTNSAALRVRVTHCWNTMVPFPRRLPHTISPLEEEDSNHRSRSEKSGRSETRASASCIAQPTGAAANAIRVILRPALTASSRQRCSRPSSLSALGSSFLRGWRSMPGRHTGNQPTRLAHLDDGNDRAILVQGDEGPAQSLPRRKPGSFGWGIRALQRKRFAARP